MCAPPQTQKRNQRAFASFPVVFELGNASLLSYSVKDVEQIVT